MKPTQAALDWIRELDALVKRCPRGYWIFTGDDQGIHLLKLGSDGNPKFGRNQCVDQSMIVGTAKGRPDKSGPWIDGGAW